MWPIVNLKLMCRSMLKKLLANSLDGERDRDDHHGDDGGETFAAANGTISVPSSLASHFSFLSFVVCL